MDLKQLVNNPPLWEAFTKELHSRIETAHRTMEQATDVEVVYRLQGQIVALRRLLKLRDEINQKDK